MKIPEDIYRRVLDIATELANSSGASDVRAYWNQYNELRDVCESETASGRAHPFLFETLADFTDNDETALSLYRQGLELADRNNANEYRASIRFAMAERYKHMGRQKLSYEHALLANEAARNLDDLELRREISEFLLNKNKND